jgi:hypothetical protein
MTIRTISSMMKLAIQGPATPAQAFDDVEVIDTCMGARRSTDQNRKPDLVFLDIKCPV